MQCDGGHGRFRCCGMLRALALALMQHAQGAAAAACSCGVLRRGHHLQAAFGSGAAASMEIFSAQRVHRTGLRLRVFLHEEQTATGSRQPQPKEY